MTIEQEILAVYDSNPRDVFSIHEIAKRAGKAYPYVHRKVNGLIDQGILRRTPMGRSHLCSVNLDNKHAILLLSHNELDKHKNVPEHAMTTAKVLEKRLNGHLFCLIYDPASKELLVVTMDEKPVEGHVAISIQELTVRLLEDASFFADRIILAGYEHYYTLMGTAEIERRYHPLL